MCATLPLDHPQTLSVVNNTSSFLRWGSKLVNDGEISFYQFMVAFMGVYFSGMAAGTLFSFSGSK